MLDQVLTYTTFFNGHFWIAVRFGPLNIEFAISKEIIGIASQGGFS